MSETPAMDTDHGGVRPERWRPGQLPRHIAFIMDGNGRWARNRGLPRLRGHEEGAKALRRITRHCRRLGVKELTYYALSTENMARRPAAEISLLMGLLKAFLVSERKEMVDNGIRLKSIGRLEAFSGDVIQTLRESEELTRAQTGMVLRLALNYGGRQEILDAVRRIAAEVAGGRMTEDQARSIDEGTFRRYLGDPEMTDPDLLVRTAGEFRVSNFLLWQCSYTEIWVTQALWPDFDEARLDEALEAFRSRERKYGAIEPGGAAERGAGTRGLEGTTRRGDRPAEG